MNLACVLGDAASEHPERTALLFEGERISYGELDRRAAVAAAALQERGVQAGDRVALKLPNTPEYVAAYFGILRLGAVAVPLNVLLAQPEVETRLEAASPTAFVDSPLRSEGLRPEQIVDHDDDDPAALLFTSGTTGAPSSATSTWLRSSRTSSLSRIRVIDRSPEKSDTPPHHLPARQRTEPA